MVSSAQPAGSAPRLERAGKTFDQTPDSFASKGSVVSRGLHSPLQWLRWIGRNSKRLAVFLLGTAIVGAGLAMLVLPGPGLLVVIVGLAVLATEFAWAERALDRTTSTAANAASKVSNNAAGRRALVLSGVCMVIGGALVVALFGDHRLIGASVLVAGLIGLGTLLPAVQRWIEARTQASARQS